MTVPSPPGRWNRPPSARVSTSTSTPAETRKIAASTNDTAPKARDRVGREVAAARDHDRLLIPRQEHRQPAAPRRRRRRSARRRRAWRRHRAGAAARPLTPQRRRPSRMRVIGRHGGEALDLREDTGRDRHRAIVRACAQPRLRRAPSTSSSPFAEPTLPARSVARSMHRVARARSRARPAQRAHAAAEPRACTTTTCDRRAARRASRRPAWRPSSRSDAGLPARAWRETSVTTGGLAQVAREALRGVAVRRRVGDRRAAAPAPATGAAPPVGGAPAARPARWRPSAALRPRSGACRGCAGSRARACGSQVGLALQRVARPGAGVVGRQLGAQLAPRRRRTARGPRRRWRAARSRAAR